MRREAFKFSDLVRLISDFMAVWESGQTRAVPAQNKINGPEIPSLLSDKLHISQTLHEFISQILKNISVVMKWKTVIGSGHQFTYATTACINLWPDWRIGKISTVETLYNTVNFCWSTHKRHSIARPKGRGMGCLLWVQRATYCVDLSKLSSIKYLL